MKKIKTKTKTKTAKKTEYCPISTVLSLIGHKWKIFVIRDLLEGAKRFNELKKSTGASQKSLTIHLRELEDRGIVERKAYKEVPPRVEYSLTDIGYSLAPVLESMAQWGTDYTEYLRLKEKMKKSE